MTEYTVYIQEGEIFIAEAEDIASDVPAGAYVALVTESQDMAATAVSGFVLQGCTWNGNDWLEPAWFNCDKCQRPAEPDGHGKFRHAEPADAVACSLISGGGMLAALLDD